MSYLASVVKSVQYGTVTLGVGITTNTATITSVDTTKTVLINLGNTSDGNNAGGMSDFCRIVLTNATTVTAISAGSSGSRVVGFCVLELK